jgi:hypothetical protein
MLLRGVHLLRKGRKMQGDIHPSKNLIKVSGAHFYEILNNLDKI